MAHVINASPAFENKTAVDNLIKLDEAIYALTNMPLSTLGAAKVYSDSGKLDGRAAVAECIHRLLDLHHALVMAEMESTMKRIMERTRKP